MSVVFASAAAALAAVCSWPARSAMAAYGVVCRSLLLVVLPMGGLAFGAAALLPPSFADAAVCWLVICAVPLAAIDVAVRRLPDLLTGAAFAGVSVLLAAAAVAAGSWPSLLRAAAGAAALAGFFVLLAFARPGSAGLGDAKLGLSVGALGAWFGWSVLVTGLLGAFVLAAVCGLWLVASGRAGMRASLPFGPFMLTGCLAIVLLAAR